MSHQPLRMVVPLSVLALAALAAGCTAAPTQAVAPIEPTTATTTSSTSDVATPAPSPAPSTPSRTAVPTRRPETARPAAACLGAVTYTIHAAKPRPSAQKVCIAVGGVLRVEYLEPGGLIIRPAGKVSCAFEAAVHECRLIGTGTLNVLINSFYWTHTFTLVVAETATPPRPAPACVSTGIYTVDASENGPPWRALCLKVGVVLRIANHGPGGFEVSPQANVSCFYEAGVRECRFRKAGTVTFTVTKANEVRPLIVVAVR